MTTLVTTERTGKMKKIGGGLRVSLEYEMDETRMSSIRMWVAKKAMFDEIRIVNEGINVLREGANTKSIGPDPNFDSVLDIQLHYATNSGYQVDLLCAKREDAEKYIKAHKLGGNSSASLQVYNREIPENGGFSGLINNLQIVNTVQGPTRLAIFDDVTTSDPDLGTALVDNELLGVDTRFSLIFYQQARGILSEEKYDPRTQVRERFLSRWFGWYLQDPDARVSFRYT